MRWQVLVSIVSIASTFTFLSVFWWALQRRRERESFHRHDLARRLVERGEADKALEWLREQETALELRRRQGMRLAAWLALAVGIGVLIPQKHLGGEDALPGWISLAAGAGLFLHLLFTRKKP